MSEEFILAFSTFPDLETARQIGRELTESSLIACVNIVPAVESIYVWKDKVETNTEALAIFKTTAARYPEFESRLRALHPYDIPEIVAHKIEHGLPEYLRCVSNSCA